MKEKMPPMLDRKAHGESEELIKNLGGLCVLCGKFFKGSDLFNKLLEGSLKARFTKPLGIVYQIPTEKTRDRIFESFDSLDQTRRGLFREKQTGYSVNHRFQGTSSFV
ncbi:MAG TPA: hypothetical protein VK206_15945, partial [Anaerolineales bacterium]|nr:hypothetical protein [Anaerolineales bacterium]